MNKKRRVLVCTDAHYLHTGYGKYVRELFTRLAETGKYVLAELACYGTVDNGQDYNAKWRFYANAVPEKDGRFSAYNSHPQNEHGKWRFERVLLDFKPDVVIDYRDPYVFDYQFLSPLRPYFHWAISPTVDSAPQKNEWLNMFASADAVFTYSDFGMDVLQEEMGGSSKLQFPIKPGVDLEVYRPVANRAKHRKQLGFFPDANVIGMVARNNPRKLYPDLMASFRRFLDLCYERGEHELANKTFLYLHCSYPDVAWDIPSLLQEHGLGRKTIFTYVCRNCKHVSVNFFQDARTFCTRCRHVAAVLPSTVVGVSDQDLAKIYNLFDAYIQYVNCEGAGFPQMEALACGLPVMTVDYSAMSDIVKTSGAIPLEVEREFRDVGTHSYRALPNNEKTAESIFKFFKKPMEIRNVMGKKSRRNAEKYYNWDITARKWESYLDNLTLTGLQGKWDAPERTFFPAPPMPKEEEMSRTEFVYWAIRNVMQEPELCYSLFAQVYIRDLNYGMRQHGADASAVTRQMIYDRFLRHLNNKIECEAARVGKLVLEPEDYLQYAHNRDKYLEL